MTVGARAYFINNGGFQVNKDGPGDVLAGTSLHEEGVEGVISTSEGLVRGHLAIRLDAMLKAVELPAAITNLASGLANVN